MATTTVASRNEFARQHPLIEGIKHTPNLRVGPCGGGGSTRGAVRVFCAVRIGRMTPILRSGPRRRCDKPKQAQPRPTMRALASPRVPADARGTTGAGGVEALGEAARHSPRQMRPVESSGNEEGTVQRARRDASQAIANLPSPEGRVAIIRLSARHTTRETKVAREPHTWHRRARSGLDGARRRRTHSAGGRGVAYG